MYKKILKGDNMKQYTVEPGKHAATWMVKIEGVAPDGTYDEYDQAIEAGKQMAEENKPSKLTILDKEKNVQEEITFD